MFSFVDNIGLDPVSGTGTSNLAALKAWRNSVGIEIDSAGISVLPKAGWKRKEERRCWIARNSGWRCVNALTTPLEELLHFRSTAPQTPESPGMIH